METVIRVILIYLVILFGLRILGKREFGQLSPLELISLLLVPELVGQSVLKDDFSLTNSLVALTSLFSLVFITSLARYLSKNVEKVISGEPTILVSHGTFIENNLHKERVDAAEIFSEMHKSGLHQLEQVKWAILESDGKISIISIDEMRPSHVNMDEENRVS
jgi:uncharacterized membrane protein YcaP (DUF421 family)